jgi:hypothetical protein
MITKEIDKMMDPYTNEVVEKDGCTYLRPNKERVMGFVNMVYNLRIHDPSMYMTKCDAIAAYVHLLVELTYADMDKHEICNHISEVWDRMTALDGYEEADECQ